MKNKKNKKRLVRKPSFFIFYILGPIAIIWFKIKTKLKIKKAKIEKGSLIIAPHRSYYDFLIVPIACYPKRVHVVSTNYWFRNKKLARLLKIIGVIPRDQYRNDIKSIKAMQECLKRGENVLIFPEGQMSTYGTPLLMPDGLDKLIYKFKPNVYFVSTDGAYLNSPKWNRTISRRGRIDAEVKKIISKDDLSSITLKDVNRILKDEFNKCNDFDYLRQHPEYKYIKKNKAEGLQNTIFYCPHCHSLMPFNPEKNKIICEKCYYTLEFENDNYNFKNSDIRDLEELFKINKDMFKLEMNSGLVLYDKARINLINPDLTEVPLFDGFVKMDHEYIYFIYEENSEKNLVFELSKMINFVTTLGVSFEVPTSDTTYRIYTDNPKHIILYWFYFNMLKEEKNEANN